MAFMQPYRNTHTIYSKQKYRQISRKTHIHAHREEYTVVDVPTDAERRQIAPFEGKPNQTRNVISVTVVLGFKAVMLTSDKTSKQSHPRTCARVQSHTYTYIQTQTAACCATGLRKKSSVSSSKIQAFALNKPQNFLCT